MPHFTAIAFDRLIDSGDSKSPADQSKNSRMTVSRPPLSPRSASGKKLESRNSAWSAQRRVPRPQMTPSLYATPEATPLPDSPSSFPPSPYIINHKRRGPRLGSNLAEANATPEATPLPDSPSSFPPSPYIINHKRRGPRLGSNLAEANDDSSREDNAAGEEAAPGTRETASQVVAPPVAVAVASHMSESIKDGHANGAYERQNGCANDGDAAKGNKGQKENSNGGLIGEDDTYMPFMMSPNREGESEDFYDPQDSMSYASNTDMEDYGSPAENSKITSSGGEFYDAWEELSSDNGPQSSHRAVEEELREIRLSLLMEIEQRKQAEEALRNVRSRWQRMREQLSLVGLTLPADPTEESELLDASPAEELSQQVQLARFVSEAVGRGIAKAEAETLMEAQIEAKNFEIARLLDRLHYYEAVNHEMSQRNQEAIEISRQRRQLRKRKQRWIWGAIAAGTITMGVAALSWSYIQSGKGSSFHHTENHVPESSHEANR